MKKILCFSLLICCLCLFASEGNAISSADYDTSYYVFNTPVLPGGESVADIIKKTYSQERVDAVADGKQTSKYIQTPYYVDLSVYAVEYYMDQSFLAQLSSAMSNGLELPQYNGNPTIYIPIFSIVDGVERIIGAARLHYDYTKEEYKCSPSFMNSTGELFLSGETRHFLEYLGLHSKSQSVQSTTGILDVTATMLISLRGSRSGVDPKVALIHSAKSGLLVYDFRNAAQYPEGKEQIVSSVDQFMQQYYEHEAVLEQNNEITSGMVAEGPGGKVGEYKSKPDLTAVYALICIGIVSILVLFYVRKIKRR